MYLNKLEYTYEYLNREYLKYIKINKKIEKKKVEIKLLNSISTKEYMNKYNIKLKYLNMIMLYKLILNKNLDINTIIDNKIAGNIYFQILNKKFLNREEINKFFSKFFSNIILYYTQKNFLYIKNLNKLIIKNLDILYNYRLSKKIPVFYNKFKGSYELKFSDSFIYLYLNLFFFE